MLSVRVFTVVLFFVSKSNQNSLSIFMKIPDLIKLEGYKYEMHAVITSDGYILRNHRIPGTNSSLYPVVFFAGLSSSSRDFLIKRKRGLPYLLSNRGHDVWLMTTRQTEETTHVDYPRSSPAFWDFGYEETGAIDVPEGIDKVLEVSGAKKVITVGLSSGNSLYAMGCSARPDFNDKIAYHIGFAFVWYGENAKKTYSEILTPELWRLLYPFGVNHLETPPAYRDLVVYMCRVRSRQNPCYKAFANMYGENWKNIDWKNSRLHVGRYSAISYWQYMHAATVARAGSYMGNFGYSKRSKRQYYPLSACRAPTVMYYGLNDPVNTLNDTMRAAEDLRAVNVTVFVYPVKAKLFGHMDFFAGAKDTDEFYRDVLAMMKTM